MTVIEIAASVTQPDSLPVIPTLIAAAVLWVAYIAYEFRVAKRNFESQHASHPVVVTGSGHRSTRGVRACGGVR